MHIAESAPIATARELRNVRYAAIQWGSESDRKDISRDFLTVGVLIDVGILRKIYPLRVIFLRNVNAT